MVHVHSRNMITKKEPCSAMFIHDIDMFFLKGSICKNSTPGTTLLEILHNSCMKPRLDEYRGLAADCRC